MIPIYNNQDFLSLKQVGKIAAKALDFVCLQVTPGVTTQLLNDKFNQFLLNYPDCKPACLGYKGFPKSLCVSINEEICHGIPGAKIIKEGDLVSVDLVIEQNGYFADTCKTVIAKGSADSANTLESNNLLLQATKQALDTAVLSIKPGMFFNQIGQIISNFIDEFNKTNHTRFDIVKDYCAHGIGKKLHHLPQISHYFNKFEPKVKILPGMCFTIEPMICADKADCQVLSDNWTVISTNKSVCAQFEHTIFMTSTGPIVLTSLNEN